MPENLRSLLLEARAALRGVLALLVGDRTAASYFDLTLTGLVGSFIALATALLVMSVPRLLLSGGAGDSLTLDLLISMGIYGVAIGTTAAFLRLVRRREALVPIMATQNWSAAFLNVLLLVVVLVGGLIPGIAVLLVGFVISINILRLIGGLRAGQIVGLFAFQFGVFFVIAMGYTLTLSPEDLARLSNLPA